MELIKIDTNEQGLLVVDSRVIAENLDIKHKNLLDTIKKYLGKIEESFGRVAFETQALETKGGSQLSTVAHLTEDQALFIGTLSRNTEKVVEFKTVLVKSFQEARRLSQKQLPTDFIESLEMLLESKKKEKQLAFELENKTYELEKATEVIKEQAPAVEYTQKVLQSTDTYTTTQIAKELDITADKLYNILMNRGILFKQSGTYMLYGKYQGQNLSKVRTHSFTGSTGEQRSNSYLVWTEKGREFIHRQVNSNLNFALVQTQTSATA